MSRKIINDIFLNLVASSQRTLVLNFILYPSFAIKFSTDDYGNILTLISVINLLIAVLGNCLNNTRLLLNKREDIDNASGNYNLIILVVSVLGVFIGGGLFYFSPFKTLISSILFSFTIAFGIARSYYLVSYRLKIDYISQLKTNLIVSCGYILGMLVVYDSDYWPLPFFLAEMAAFVYMTKTINLLQEPFTLNEYKEIIISTYIDVMALGLIGNIIAYFDRFFINPLLGASNVAIFYVAAFWGKAAAPFVAPIANVLLSYLCQKDIEVSKKKFITLFICGMGPLIVFGILGIWMAPWIVAILYPSLVDDAMPFIFIASIGCLLQSATDLISPLIMSITNSRSLLVMQSGYFFAYLFLSFICIQGNGLLGFCVASVIIGVLKTVVYFAFGYMSLSTENRGA